MPDSTGLPGGAHPEEDELVELALSTLPSVRQTELLDHLSGCATCRSVYDDLSAGVDLTLAAAPEVQPGPGFDGRVLAALPSVAAADREVRPLGEERRGSRRRWVMAAAAAAVGVAVGTGATYVALDSTTSHSQPGPITRSALGEALVTGKGDVVGSVVPTRYDGQQLLAMQITNAPPGMHYFCRLIFDDGGTRDGDGWSVGRDGTAVWLERVGRDVREVELVNDSGKVWSRARLHD